MAHVRIENEILTSCLNLLYSIDEGRFENLQMYQPSQHLYVLCRKKKQHELHVCF